MSSISGAFPAKSSTSRLVPDFGAALPLLVQLQGADRPVVETYELGQLIRFNQGADSAPAFGDGWHVSEEWGRWTGPTAELSLSFGAEVKTRDDLALSVVLFLYSPGLSERRVEVEANGEPLFRFVVPPGDDRVRLLRCPLPRPGPLLRIGFRFPDAVSPVEFGFPDGRVLGGAFRALSIDLAGAPRVPVPDGAIVLDAVGQGLDVVADAQAAGGGLALEKVPQGAAGTRRAGAAEPGAAAANQGGVEAPPLRPRASPLGTLDSPDGAYALLLRMELDRSDSARILDVHVDGGAFEPVTVCETVRSLVLRVGPIHSTCSDLQVAVTDGSGRRDRLVQPRSASLIGWCDDLPEFRDGTHLFEVLPQYDSQNVSEERLIAARIDSLSNLLDRRHHESLAEIRRVSAALSQQAAREREGFEAVGSRLNAIEDAFRGDLLKQQRADTDGAGSHVSNQLEATRQEFVSLLSSAHEKLDAVIHRDLLKQQRADTDGAGSHVSNQLEATRQEFVSLLSSAHEKLDTVIHRDLIPFDSETMIAKVESGYVLVPRSDFLLLLHLYDCAGRYEIETSAAFRRLVEPGMHAVDVGANVGVHMLTLGRLVGPGRVTAIEPSPVLSSLLPKTTAMNGLAGVISVIGKAAGKQAGEAKLYAGITSGHASLLPQPHSFGEFDIEVDRLDHLVEGPADLVKIDAEGMEIQILSGMTELLKNRDIVLVVEFGREHLARTKHTSKRWFAAFARQGFAAFLIGPGGTFASVDVKNPRDGNYVFVRPDSRSWALVNAP